MPTPFVVEKYNAIQKFKLAILSVAPSYFSWSGASGVRRYGERVFAYELYHQLRIQFKEAHFINGEFVKGLSMIPALGRKDVIVPDLVIHQPATLEHNLVAVEIKARPRTTIQNLYDDWNKLEFYTRPVDKAGLNFVVGILVAVNFDAERLLREASCEMKCKFLELARKSPRVAIWNIVAPQASSRSSSGALVEECLNILRVDLISSLVGDCECLREHSV